ncbi:MAG: aminotransferase class V-fold PLP-dependent enzyme, partial [Candidatus Thorarchaeota archaeon]
MEFNWDEIREKEFPVFKNNINLKAAGGSPMSKSAYDSGLRYFNDMLNQGDIHWDEYFKELNCIREKIANYLNAKPSEIAFLINTSSCMNAIARLIRKGKIIYPEGEFPSSIHAFKRLGFNSTKIKHRGYKYSLEDLERGINKSTTCLIHSHIQYLTGFRQDLEKLGLLCKKSNVISIINATQSFGAFPIDAKQCKINIIVASALKWACCGYGIGILYISEEVMEKFELPFSSWLSVKDP